MSNKTTDTLNYLKQQNVSFAHQLLDIQTQKELNDLILSACNVNESNVQLYIKFREGFLTEREFIEALDITEQHRYQLALAFLDSFSLANNL